MPTPKRAKQPDARQGDFLALLANTLHSSIGQPMILPEPPELEPIDGRYDDDRAIRRHLNRLIQVSGIGREVIAERMTDVQRAARFLTLQRLVYGGVPGSTSFPARRQRPENLSATDLRRAVEAVHDRLARVTIECLDYQDFISRYDGPDVLFYLDPPYYLCEHYYGKGLFRRDDFGKLAELLGSIKGRFLMSINDHPEIRRLFAAFRIDEELVNYRIGSVVKPVVELVISRR